MEGLNRQEVMQIIEGKLRDLNLDNHYNMFIREHNPLDGTHKESWAEAIEQSSFNAPWVDVRDYGSFALALDAIGATKTTLVIPDQQNVTDDKTVVPANVTLWFLQGGTLSIGGGKTVTINGHVDAGLYQIFEGAGSVVFGAGAVKEVYPEWWGADNSGATSSTSAFNATLASGCLKPALQPGASYKIKDVVLPQVSGFHLKGNWATIVPDESSGTPDTCFSGTVIGTVKNYTIEKMFLSGNVTDFIKITQTDPSGFMLYWHLQDFYTVNGTGSSIVKLVNDSASNAECIYIKRITVLDPALFDHILFMTYTDGHVGFGVVVCEDFYLNEGSSVGQSVIYSDVASWMVTSGRFTNIFGTRGTVIALNATFSRFQNIWMEVSEDDCTLMTGTYRNCTMDGLRLQNAIPATNTGDKLFVGTMVNTNVWKVMHLRVGVSIGSDIVVELSADSEYSYWDSLFDGWTIDFPLLNQDYLHWVSVEDLGENNSYRMTDISGNASLVWNPGNLVDGAGETSGNITVTGAVVTDRVDVYPPYSLQAILCQGYVSAADTVNIRLQNETGGAIDLASGTWKVKTIKALI